MFQVPLSHLTLGVDGVTHLHPADRVCRRHCKLHCLALRLEDLRIAGKGASSKVNGFIVRFAHCDKITDFYCLFSGMQLKGSRFEIPEAVV